MALSQFTTAKFDADGKISVGGPFELHAAEKGMEVMCLHFLLTQGAEFITGTGIAGGTGAWSGKTGVANNLEAGKPAQAVGFAVLVGAVVTSAGNQAGHQIYSWSHTITIEPPG
jgi:hypothetical protein